MKLGEIDSVKFLAQKSGGVIFLTNSMSDGMLYFRNDQSIKKQNSFLLMMLVFLLVLIIVFVIVLRLMAESSADER